MNMSELRQLIDDHRSDLDRAGFWRLVEASKPSNTDPREACDEQIRRLQRLLNALRPEAIVQFDRI